MRAFVDDLEEWVERDHDLHSALNTARQLRLVLMSIESIDAISEVRPDGDPLFRVHEDEGEVWTD